jgi:HK97 family phage portal protein
VPTTKDGTRAGAKRGQAPRRPSRRRLPEVRGNPDLVGWSTMGPGPVFPFQQQDYLNAHQALTLPTYTACVRNIAEDVAKLPLIVYEDDGEGEKRRLTTDPLYRLLHDAPNPEQSALAFVEAIVSNAVGWGNGYAEIVTDGTGEARELWILNPDRTTPRRTEGGALFYEYRQPDGTAAALPPERVLHVHGLAFDGIVGYTPAQLFARSLQAHSAQRDFAGAFYVNGAAPSALLKHPGKLTPAAHEQLRREWESMHQGPDRAGRTAILEEGMDLVPITINPRDAQFLETARFGIEDIARMFRMPPHMVGDLSRGTFSNIEHLSIEYVTNTLLAWIRRLETALRRSVLAVRGPGVYAEVLIEGALRGDTKSRYDAYAVGRQWGWLSSNDIRRLENMPPVEGGDTYLQPLNMVDASKPPPTAPPQEGPAASAAEPGALGDTGAEGEAAGAAPRALSGGPELRALVLAATPPLLDAAARMVDKERRAVSNAAGSADAETRLDRFYAVHVRQLAEALEPAARTLHALLQLAGFAPAALPEAVAIEAASAHVEWSRRELSLCGAAGAEAAANAWAPARTKGLAENVLRRLAGQELLE